MTGKFRWWGGCWRDAGFKSENLCRGLFSRELPRTLKQAGETYAVLAGQHPVSFRLVQSGSMGTITGVLALGEQTQLCLRSRSYRQRPSREPI